jgi:ubiquinone/menaquinone biosynthesis C-methylase UbiE
MTDLKSPFYLNQLEQFRRNQLSTGENKIFGLHWGDPDAVESLKSVRDRFILPYINAAHDALEIGPGGGRWTRYLLGFRKLYVVDFHDEILRELKKNFNEQNMAFIQNNGTDFPGIQESSIDYLFSFGTFVHLDLNIIDGYLESMKTIVKPQGNIVLQYADKTKKAAQMDTSFSENTPEKMRSMVVGAGYRIIEEDVATLWHSSMIRFSLSG